VVDDAEPDVVVGYVQTMEFEANQAATGRREAYLAKLGVRRSYRGRGLATALLRDSLRAYQAAGYDESCLDVDTNNPSGAFQLYERVGYRIEHRTVAYQLVVPAQAADADSISPS
jgi:mycothiol synthase